MANAQRKTWIHGFFTNTFNNETGNWQLRDSRNEALIAEGPKAAKLGKLGAAMTRTEKAYDKMRNLERQLQKEKLVADGIDAQPGTPAPEGAKRLQQGSPSDD